MRAHFFCAIFNGYELIEKMFYLLYKKVSCL